MRNDDRPTGFQRLLVALDEGAGSDGALLRGFELAQLFDARLDVVHALGALAAVHDQPGGLVQVARPAELVTAVAAVRRRLQRRVAELRARAGGPRGAAETVEVIAGRPPAVVVRRAASTRADLVVLGGLRERNGFDFGSTARAVLAKAPCAVWLQPGPPAPLRRILVAVDFSTESGLALAAAIELARRTSARVRALHVFDPLAFREDDGGTAADLAARALVARAFEAAMADVDWRGVEHEWSLASGAPARVIEEHAEAADLVVLGQHGRTGLASALLGGVAHDVLVHVERPVLAVRDPARAYALG